MTETENPTLSLLIELIQRPSVTPDDGGCQDLIAARLEKLGFTIERLDAGKVKNLWARRGDEGPLFAFAGHTDVVPTGEHNSWTYPPFSATLSEGFVYGRGAADMKGGVAAMVTALERYVESGKHQSGSLALVLTSDEEGPAIDGIRHVMDVLSARGEHIDRCILGEPSSTERLGDTVRQGRRGSLGARLVIKGVQGHVAFPTLADNPVHRSLAALQDLCSTEWDKGNASFPPTTLQISNAHAGTGATNVIPGTFTVDFNLRYSSASTMESLQSRIVALLDSHGLDYDIGWNDTARPFLTEAGRLVEAVRETVQEELGIEPTFNTAGGTSDGRFIVPTGTDLVELGPLNATIHQVDECVNIDDIIKLSTLYERLLEKLL